MSTSISSSLEMLFGKMEGFVTTKTVVGDPVQIGDVIIVPLVDVMFGVGAHASENAKEENEKKDGSAGALGAKINPVAVLVIMNDTVQLVNVKNQDNVNKLIDLVPGILSKLNFGEIFKNKDKNNNELEGENVEVKETAEDL